MYFKRKISALIFRTNLIINLFFKYSIKMPGIIFINIFSIMISLLMPSYAQNKINIKKIIGEKNTILFNKLNLDDPYIIIQLYLIFNSNFSVSFSNSTSDDIFDYIKKKKKTNISLLKDHSKNIIFKADCSLLIGLNKKHINTKKLYSNLSNNNSKFINLTNKTYPHILNLNSLGLTLLEKVIIINKLDKIQGDFDKDVNMIINKIIKYLPKNFHV